MQLSYHKRHNFYNWQSDDKIIKILIDKNCRQQVYRNTCIAQKQGLDIENAKVFQMQKLQPNHFATLQACFQQIRGKKVKKLVQNNSEQSDTDAQLQFMLKQAKEKNREHQQSTFWDPSKQNSLQQSKDRIIRSQKNESKSTLSDMFERFGSRISSKDQSRSRDKPKPSKKKTNLKKLDKNQSVMEQYFPKLLKKPLKNRSKGDSKKEKQLTLDFFCKQKSIQDTKNSKK